MLLQLIFTLPLHILQPPYMPVPGQRYYPPTAERPECAWLEALVTLSVTRRTHSLQGSEAQCRTAGGSFDSISGLRSEQADAGDRVDDPDARHRGRRANQHR